MVSTRPHLSKFVKSIINPIVTAPSAPIKIGIMFHSYFSIWKQGLGTYRSFHFLLVLPFDHLERRCPQFDGSSSFCLLSRGQVVWLRFGELFIYQNSRNLWHVPLQDGFWFLHIPFIHIVKFKLIAHFAENHLAHTVVSSFILFLY